MVGHVISSSRARRDDHTCPVPGDDLELAQANLRAARLGQLRAGAAADRRRLRDGDDERDRQRARRLPRTRRHPALVRLASCRRWTHVRVEAAVASRSSATTACWSSSGSRRAGGRAGSRRARTRSRSPRCPGASSGGWSSSSRSRTRSSRRSSRSRLSAPASQDLPAPVLLDRGQVDDGRGRAAELAAVDREVDAGRDLGVDVLEARGRRLAARGWRWSGSSAHGGARQRAPDQPHAEPLRVLARRRAGSGARGWRRRGSPARGAAPRAPRGSAGRGPRSARASRAARSTAPRRACRRRVP